MQVNMVQHPDKHTKHFQIGVIPVSLCTRIRALRRQYTLLYRDFLVPHSPVDAIRIDVRPSRFSLRRRRRYEIFVNGRLRFEPQRSDEVLPYVEWAINWELARVMPQYLQLHASSMEINGQGVIFPAVSGSGKSTLTMGLLTRGWRYLCDEFALIDADTLALHPYPRAICIKKPSFRVVKSVGVALKTGRHYHKGTKGDVRFINPLTVKPDAVGQTCPIRYVIFPKYTAGARPTLIPISRAKAAFDLHHVCFNLFGCQTQGLDVLAAMIRGAECYRLIAGDLQDTCDLLERLVERPASQHARSA